MGIHYSPAVIQDGLVFYYDMGNSQKSWKGAPTTNIYPIDSYISWPTETYHFWNGYSWTVGGIYTHPGVDGPEGIYLGKVRKYTSGALSSTWSGNSYAYVLKTATMTQGQSYAMSAYSYASPDCNLDYITSSIEGATTSALPGYSTDYDMSRKGSWQRHGMVGVAPAGSVNFIPSYASKFGTTTGVFTGFYMVAATMVELGTFATPYTDTTRSNTQAILDLVGNRTITASSLTYHANNTFSFDGTANQIDVASNFGTLSQYTISFWAKRDAEGRMPIGWRAGPSFYWYGDSSWAYTHGGVFGEYYYSKPTSIPLGTWGHYCVTYDGANVRIYRQGEFQGLQATTGTADWTNGLRIGYWAGGAALNYYWQGRIDAVSFYNRALSALEVEQNFSALRGRYGV